MVSTPVRYGIIGLFTALLVGGFVYLNSGEKNFTYVCPGNGEIGVFYGGLSSSMQRAYPYDNTTQGYKDCKYPNGTREEWATCDDYAKQFNASCSEPEIPVVMNASFSCSFDKPPELIADMDGWNGWQFNGTNNTITLLLTNSSNYTVTW